MASSTAMPSSISLFSKFLPSSSQSHTTFLPRIFFKPPKSLPSISQTRPTTTTICCQLATLPILSFDGEKIGETTLDIKSARPETARAVIHRGIVTDLRNRRRGTASTLTRAEVRGGGRKPYRQKKTGHARRGSQRTPLRPGGGVIFGPKPRDWSIKINRKEKRLAISTALASAAVNGIVVEDFGDKFDKPKTKEFITVLKRWGIDPKEKSMFLMTEISDNLNLSSRNIGTCKMLTPRTLNLFDILNADKLVFTKGALEYLNDQYGYEEEYEDDEEEEGDFESGAEGETEAEAEGEAETEAESGAEGTESEGDADASPESEGDPDASE